MPTILLSRRALLTTMAVAIPTFGPSTARGSSDAAVVTAAEARRMRRLASAFMDRWRVPGLQVAIAREGIFAYRRAFGIADRATGAELTVDSLFRVASLSKPITSVAVHKLIEAGELGPADEVFGPGALLGTRYGSRPYAARLRRITVEHLLTHTAGGWANDASDPMFTAEHLPIEDLIDRTLDDRPLSHEPGTRFAYSNFGYALLGRIIERVSGEAYGDHVRKAVLKPCGIAAMRIAGNKLSERLSGEVCYYGQGGEDPYAMNVRRMDAHGGWLGTATDLVSFLRRVDNFSGVPDILRPRSIRSMTRATQLNAGYAKGWQVNEYDNWWHTGSLPGSTAIMVRTSGNFCWAALVNTRVPGNAMILDLDNLIWEMAAVPHRWRL